MKFNNKSFEETYNDVGCVIVDDNVYLSVTAEQMIGWLEEHYFLSFDVYQPHLSWSCSVKHKDEEFVFLDSLDSRKEATIAAIDAALDYLT